LVSDFDGQDCKECIDYYFEKVVYEHLTWEIPPLWFLELSVEGYKKNAQTIVCNSTLILCFTRNKNKIIFQAIECVSGLYPFEA
jgi:hypothetical protein